MTRNKPFLLITNDDGIYAPGIKHLWSAVKDFADITIVAPAGEQSAVSLSSTIRHPLHIEKINWPENTSAWSVSGTPSDCVKLALKVLLPRYPDLIISGINRGTNGGRNVLYSGTVAAIIEGVLHDVPGIAFSNSDYHQPQFAWIEKLIPNFIDYALQHPFPKGTFLNVNFPYYTPEGIKGIRMTRQGKQLWIENPEQRAHPSEGNFYYWLGSKLAEFEELEDSDVAWLKKGYATAVPIHVSELTNHSYLNQNRELFETFINR
jgi:5'-nucleotidase